MQNQLQAAYMFYASQLISDLKALKLRTAYSIGSTVRICLSCNVADGETVFRSKIISMIGTAVSFTNFKVDNHWITSQALLDQTRNPTQVTLVIFEQVDDEIENRIISTLLSHTGLTYYPDSGPLFMDVDEDDSGLSINHEDTWA